MNRIFNNSLNIQNQYVDLSFFDMPSRRFHIKREDLLHPEVSGNKFRKLRYNIEAAREENATTLLTFGGAYSNHIAATAAAANLCGLNSIGIIRGEELAEKERNYTLMFAERQGMKLIFVSRAAYREKEEPGFVNNYLVNTDKVYVMPEGGTNSVAIKGCQEILQNEDEEFDYICCPAGTGGTLAGLITSAAGHQKVIGFSALKGDFLRNDVIRMTNRDDFILTDSYSFGGYGKIDVKLIRFINSFKKATSIQLDPLYTGKMVYGVIDLMRSGFFKKNDRILVIHTGGLQGIYGMNERLKAQGHPQIEL